MNILEALENPDLFGKSFQGDSWEAWRAVLAGAFALRMNKRQRDLFNQLAGGREPPTQRVRELWVIAGRRSAKTHTAARIAVYLATIGAAIEGLTARLSPGETGVIALIATDRSQAKVALSYINGLFDQSPMLSAMIVKRTAESLELNNRVSIEVHTNNFRAIRGRTLLACLFDEVAFFRSESTDAADVEVYRAAVPGLATTGGLLIGISSPWGKRGLLYERFRKHYGRNSDILVVKGQTTIFNPTLPQSVIEQALADDPDAAKTEWLAEFRGDIEQFISREVVESCTRSGPLELPPMHSTTYKAFVDPAGGGADEFTLAIGHSENDSAIVDCIRAQRGTPAAIVAEYASVLKSYGISEAQSDRYAGSWPADEFARHNIKIIQAAQPKSDLYRDLLPRLNSGRIELPPDTRLATQLTALERRTARGGRDSIDHPPGGHDDRANAVAGLASVAGTHAGTPVAVFLSKRHREGIPC